MKRLLTVFAAALVALYVLQPAAPARAAGLIVLNTNDAGPGSLRQAIFDANAAPGADTITFNLNGGKGLPGSKIVLNSMLVVTDAVTIIGPGQPALTLDGNKSVRVMLISAPGKAVDVSGLTISGGRADIGAGIYTQSGTINLHEMTFTGNDVPLTSGSDGGGLANDAVTTVSNSIFSNNSAPFGGGLSAFANSVTLNDTLFISNFADQAGGGVINSSVLTVNRSSITGNRTGPGANAIGGGGIAATGNATLTVIDSHVDNNVSFGVGGGILGGGTTTIRGSTVNGNQNTGDGLGGGGFFGSVGTLIQDSQIKDNQALGMDSLGGGVLFCCGGTNPVGAGVIQRSLISGNVASYGGGIHTVNKGNYVLDESTVSGNRAHHGGGIFNQTSLAISNSTIDGNTADVSVGQIADPTDRAYSSAGGIFSANGNVNPGVLSLTNSTVSGNIANSPNSIGGGLQNGDSVDLTRLGTLSLRHVTLTNNAATGSGSRGGGLRSNGPLTVANTIVASNTALTGPNCQLLVAPTSATHNLISDNTCPFNGAGDLVGVNPQLGTLANNGGPTRTQLPFVTSPAINNGDNAVSSPRDQRGATRPKSGIVDIGAVEVDQANGKGIGPQTSTSSVLSEIAAPFVAELNALAQTAATSASGGSEPDLGARARSIRLNHNQGLPQLQPAAPVTPQPVAPIAPVTLPDGQPSALPGGTAPAKGR